MQFFVYIQLVIQFWSVIKEILDRLEKTPEEKRKELVARLHAASVLADEGDTSDYEDIIRNG